MHLPAPPRTLPALAVAALVLSGCSFQGSVDDDAAAPPSTSASPSASASPTSTPSSSAPSSSAPTTSAPPTEPGAPSATTPAPDDDGPTTGSGTSSGGTSEDEGSAPATADPDPGSGTGDDSTSGGDDTSDGGGSGSDGAADDGADDGAGTGGGSDQGGDPSDGGTPAPAPGEEPTSGTGVQEIRFPAGQTSTTVRGEAASGQHERYVFAASAGQQAAITITSADDGVGFDLVAPDGTPLKTTMSSAPSGRWDLTADGDYAVGIASPDDGAAYTLTLSVR